MEGRKRENLKFTASGQAGNILRIGEYSRQSLNKASTIGLDRQISTRKSWRTLQSPRQSRHVNYARTTSRHVKNETENVRWRNFSTENQAGIFDAGSEVTQGSHVCKTPSMLIYLPPKDSKPERLSSANQISSIFGAFDQLKPAVSMSKKFERPSRWSILHKSKCFI